MKRALVAFGEDWGGLPSSTQHIVSRLARERDVVWVNSIGLRAPRLDRRDLARIANKARSLMRGAPAGPKTQTARPERLSIVNPLAAPFPGSRAAQVLNRWSVGRQLRAALAARGLEKPIFWTSLPSAAPMIGALGERGVVYYCGDDFSALAGVDHEPIAALEREVADKADLVLAASAPLAAKFESHKTVLAPHGVDFERFAEPAPRAADLPETGPIAGFYGSLAEWIDVERLAAAADRLPDWTFVLIGAAQVDVSALRSRPNVRLLGPRPHEQLPGYAQHWDVSLLPFRDTPQIRACNPLKLREYLAAGTPVVATDFPALDSYRDLIAVVGVGDDLASAIAAAAGDRAADPLRRARVAGESWDARATAIDELLERL